MSSSAALEMACALAIGKISDIELTADEWARVGQGCENNVVGANTGLLDQLSSMMGKENQLVFIDFRTLDVDTVPCPDNVAFVVANSAVAHDLTQDYNERRERCKTCNARLDVIIEEQISN